MSNMSYCRFENTYRDLQDCIEHLDDEIEGSEKEYRDKLLDMIIDIANENN